MKESIDGPTLYAMNMDSSAPGWWEVPMAIRGDWVKMAARINLMRQTMEELIGAEVEELAKTTADFIQQRPDTIEEPAGRRSPVLEGLGIDQDGPPEAPSDTQVPDGPRGTCIVRYDEPVIPDGTSGVSIFPPKDEEEQ